MLFGFFLLSWWQDGQWQQSETQHKLVKRCSPRAARLRSRPRRPARALVLHALVVRSVSLSSSCAGATADRSRRAHIEVAAVYSRGGVSEPRSLCWKGAVCTGVCSLRPAGCGGVLYFSGIVPALIILIQHSFVQLSPVLHCRV